MQTPGQENMSLSLWEKNFPKTSETVIVVP